MQGGRHDDELGQVGIRGEKSEGSEDAPDNELSMNRHVTMLGD
jgi:hypothetical protein